VTVVITVASAVLMAMVAMVIYSLQWWLERSDYRRHFED
jgi:hypothetical protein